MLAILNKELNAFFSSTIGYLVIGVFLLFNGLFLFVFKDNFNILNAGFADINPFFYIAPWVFLFLIPAITMKSFADEFSSGTIEILKTSPLTFNQIILGKFLASLFLSIIAILPTISYILTIYALANPVGNIDFGSIIGSYIGLILLAATYTGVGVFTATLSRNQIIAFLLSVFVTFILFFGFDAVANLFENNSTIIQQFGIQEHYKSIARGVIDTRNVIYFITISFFFLFCAKKQLENTFRIKKLVVICIGCILINFISNSFYKRFDITSDKRFTLSKVTKNTISSLDKALHITVYLEGDFPSEFKRLQTETKQFLEELSSENKNLKISFKNPDNIRESLIKKGMMPSQLTVEENGKLSEAIIFPWAEINWGKKTRIVSLLPTTVLASQEEQLQKAIENLEHSFIDGIYTILQNKGKKIGVITGNGQLSDIYQYSYLSEVAKKYQLAKFTLRDLEGKEQQTLKDILNLDLAIIAKPTEKFTEKEKFILDQFITNGGKTLWMIDNVQADQDSLAATGKMMVYPRDLNLTNLLFSYGVRINNNLIKDLYAADIPVATGKVGNQTQFKNLAWYFHPLVSGNPNNAITKNVIPVRLQFANNIDTLPNNIKKTPLLVSSVLTQKIGTPTFISLQSIADEVVEKEYISGNQVFAILLEGNFNSAYKDRILPFKTPYFQKVSKANKMVIIADGDIGKNQLLKNKPFDLSRDKWTNQEFGNKDFLLNTIDYLLDDNGIINLRNKTVKIKMLDKQKAYSERTFWQFFNVFLPLILLFIFGCIFFYLRKRKYQK
ncbi:gliding motility-associated ABC transporter substrate-binding protein GldG [Polaribacter tangerinus]|uniref:gliding motility-associated ABC transporter substrate-binding protein GldG n=1 Tax=Polaribacter tangerinus TaxID=1920034 RepID=UPI000B4AC1E4|nr:gliding motility-associated ABC transporter substrate-binding protein GldG [Polaribacter tangerinus]